uniref:BadF/BadG/BcrA/BcrD ATPase family protein n=1 Tax=Aureimonas sp. AU4 TaxID=1638163 RepID=UPI000AF7B2FB
MAARTLYLGIDAGGSSCRARLADDREILGEAQVVGASNARAGVEAVFERLLGAARGAWSTAGLGPYDFARLRVGAGVSGIRRPGLIERFAERPHPFASVRWEDDAAIAALGAHGGREGGVVVAGTGSIAVGWAEGRRLRFGGYGFPGSDEGGGARLGLAAVEIAFLAADGRLAAGTLARDILQRAQNDPQRLVAFCDQATPADYARLCPLVLH